MTGISTRLFILPVLSVSLVLLGCSSGGDAGVAAPLYSGSTTPAAITQANADEVANKSTEGVNEAVDLTETGAGIPFAVELGSRTDALAQKIRDIALTALDSTITLNLPLAAVLTADDLNAGSPSPVFCGGSVTVPDNIEQNSSMNFSMTFNSLCFDDGITALIMNGTLVFAQTEQSVAIAFTNFSVNIDGRQESFSGIFSCDATMSGCTISTDYLGSDGNVYRLANVDIGGDDLTGYSLTATFYHPVHGQVTIATLTPVSYGGCGIYPSDGVITVTSSDGSSITVTYTGCTYSITGVDANSGSISINGSWV